MAAAVTAGSASEVAVAVIKRLEQGHENSSSRNLSLWVVTWVAALRSTSLSPLLVRQPSDFAAAVVAATHRLSHQLMADEFDFGSQHLALHRMVVVAAVAVAPP